MARETILVINNDERFTVHLKEELVRRGYSVSLATNSFQLFEELKEKPFEMVISKFGLPNLEARELIREVKRSDPDCMLIIILEEMNAELNEELLHLGIYEVFIKPADNEKLLWSVKKGLEMRAAVVSYRKLIRSLEEQNVTLQRQNSFLTKRNDELTKNLSRLYENLRTTYIKTIRALAQTIDAKDHYTHSHSENVSKYAVKIAESMGLYTQEVELIRQACELHDIGKIGINDSILTKETELTVEEKEQIKLHSLKGAQILEPLNFLVGVMELVRSHHEHYDGSGYPDGHKGEEIPLGARIIHVADAYDAMISARAYRKTPLTKQEAIIELKINSGRQFDPKVIEAFLKVVNEL